MDARHPVTVFACGERLRGDDGLAARAVMPPLPFSHHRANLRVVPHLTPDDLLRLPDGTRLVIVDAVVGPPPGKLVRLGLDELDGQAVAIRPASSHQLPLPLVFGLARWLGGASSGVFLGVGVRSVRPGEGLSHPVRDALPRLRQLIGSEVERLSRGLDEALPADAGLAVG